MGTETKGSSAVQQRRPRSSPFLFVVAHDVLSRLPSVSPTSAPASFPSWTQGTRKPRPGGFEEIGGTRQSLQILVVGASCSLAPSAPFVVQTCPGSPISTTFQETLRQCAPFVGTCSCVPTILSLLLPFYESRFIVS